MGDGIGPIQAYPAGLLSLLSLKQFGRNPSQLSNEVVPTLQTTDWYLQSAVEYVAGVQIALLALDRQALGVTIPNGEIWYIHSIGGEANLGAAEDCDVVFGYLPQGTDVVIPFTNSLPVLRGATIAPNARAIFGCEPRAFFDASCQLMAVTRSLTGTVDLETVLRITRMKR